MQLVKAFFIHTHGAHCNHYYAFTIVKSIDNKTHNQLHITIYAFALKKIKILAHIGLPPPKTSHRTILFEHMYRIWISNLVYK